MIEEIVSASFEKYKKDLSNIIIKKIILEKKEITFIDSMNYLNQYLFKIKVLERIMDRLYI
jgi:hypothetical protein